MKKSWLPLVLFGLFLGMLVTVPWVVSGPIQQQVGVNSIGTSSGTWVPECSPLTSGDNVNDTDLAPFACNVKDVQNLPMVFDGTNWDRLRSVVGLTDGNAGTGLQGMHPYVFNGVTWDRQRSAPAGDGASTTGFAASGLMGFNNATWDRVRTVTIGGQVGGLLSTSAGWSGSAWEGNFNASNANLTATTSSGVQLVAPVSTWSVTNTPGLAVQATATRAAGAAGVRHVATTVTACLAAGGTAQTPILAHLRDGASGAGTILRSWAFSAPVNTSKCDNISDLAMIGTAATAMTIEFTGAGVAGSQETVTLTGYSVQ